MNTLSDIETKSAQRLLEIALDEDKVWDDITTEALIMPDQAGKGAMVVKGIGIIAGLEIAGMVFETLDANVEWRPLLDDGVRVSHGDVIARLEGPLSPILRGERVALNLLQHLSGVATATAKLCEQVSDLPVYILDTRKTLPGLRALQKYAVRMGGGKNHRMDLSDSFLIKDNHLAALRARGLTITDAIRLVEEKRPNLGVKIEVEVENLAEVEEAIEAGANVLLLDNMSPEEMREAVKLVQGQAWVEASGGITEENVRAVAASYVDYISSGTLTHSVKGLDISLELEVG